MLRSGLLEGSETSQSRVLLTSSVILDWRMYTLYARLGSQVFLPSPSYLVSFICSVFQERTYRKYERLLCAVWALRIYTFRTLRSPENTRLLVSFQKGHEGDIHPNTLSSWLKNTIKFVRNYLGKLHLHML